MKAFALAILLYAAQAADGFVGVWVGVVTMTSIDKDGADHAADSVAFAGKELRFEVKALGGAFSGALDVGGKKITGTWTQRARTMRWRVLHI